MGCQAIDKTRTSYNQMDLEFAHLQLQDTTRLALPYVPRNGQGWLTRGQCMEHMPVPWSIWDL